MPKAEDVSFFSYLSGFRYRTAFILSPAAGGGKITSTQFFLIDKGILQWCAKGIVIKKYNIKSITPL